MPVEVTDGVQDLTVRETDEARYRAFLFEGETPTLVDVGFADTVDALAEEVAAVGVDPERAVLTHADPDHTGGLAEVADRYGLETWVPEGMDVDRVDHRFGDGDRVGRFTAVHMPGHTATHHSLVDEDAGVAVLGDAAFGADSRGLPAGYFVLPTAHFSADLAQADESLARLLGYEFEVGLVYHGSSVTSGASAKLRRFVDFAGKPD